MKKLACLFIGLFISLIIIAQSDEPCETCLPEGIEFTTQSQIDSFQINYPNCKEIEGDVEIGFHPSTTDIVNLNGLNVLSSIGGYLLIGNNDSLTSLSGLDNVTSIGGQLEILYNDAMTSLIGLDNVSSIGGGLEINWNLALTSLTGLNNVTSIGGGLSIAHNDTLTSLMGLEAVTFIGGTLMILQNIALTTCEVLSICTYLASPNGLIVISANAVGCNSQQEVEEACGITSLNELKLFREVTALPNPFTTSTTLSFRLSKPENVQFTVYNVQSQIVFEMQERQGKGEQRIQWNAEGLPAGMYYFRIQVGDKVGGGKMVKMD